MLSPTSRLASGRDFERLDGVEQVRHGDLAEALEADELVVVERVDVADVVDHARDR